jgi:hypothetical protein
VRALRLLKNVGYINLYVTMRDSSSQYPTFSVAQAADYERATFIRRTYMHLAGALLAFAFLESILLQMPAAKTLAMNMVSGGGMGWLLVLVLFMVVSWVANSWALSSTSLSLQYAGLGLYVVAEAVIFLPLLFVAQARGGADVIPAAGIATLALFGGLTATVFLTRKDFSFLGPILGVGFFVALGVIVCAVLFKFQLGPIFAGLMAVFAAGAILYSTSNVMRQYRSDQYVAAALSLFAAVALLFWYILQLFLSRED